MNLHKKTLLIHEITFAAIAAALTIILFSFTLLFQFFTIVVIFASTLIGTLVSSKTGIKIQVAFFLVIVASSFINIQEGLFQLIPNTLIGLCLGNLIKLKVDIFLLFVATTIISAILNSLSYFPIILLFDVDMLEVYSTIFNLTRDEFIVVYPAFNILLSEIEMTVIILISIDELAKFKIIINKKINYELNSILFISTLFTSLILEYYFSEIVYITAYSISSIFLGIIILNSLEKSYYTKKHWLMFPALSLILIVFALFIASDLKRINIALLYSFLPLAMIELFSSLKKYNFTNDYYFLDASANIFKPAVVNG